MTTAKKCLTPCLIAVAFIVIAASASAQNSNGAAAGQSTASGASASKEEEDEIELLRIEARPLDVTPASGIGQSVADFKKNQKLQSAAFVAASKRAASYCEKYPKGKHVSEARAIQVMSLLRAANTGSAEVEPQAMRLAREYRADTTNPSIERYHIATTVLQREMLLNKPANKGELMRRYYDRAMDLYGEFPKESAVFDLFLGVARNADPEFARATAKQILTMPAPDEIKSEAQAVIDRLDMPGKSVAIEWQDEKGDSHRLADFKGKTVVFLVWGTFAPNSAAAQDAVSAAATSNVAIVSVNVDTNTVKGKAAKMKSADLEYFDARGFQSPLAKQLLASKVPAVHVVSPKGIYVGTGNPGQLADLLAKAAAQ